MSTYEELLLKHAKMKRCKSIEEEGCGEYKEIKEFRYTFRDKGYGKRKYWDSWCAECQYLRQKKRYKYNKNLGEYGRKRPIEHPGFIEPTDKLFFITLKPPPFSIELRNARRNCI